MNQFCSSLLVSLIMLAMFVTGCDSFIEKRSPIQVKEFTGNNLISLSNGEKLRLAGIYIPTSEETNYRKYLVDNAKNLLNNNTFYMEIIETKKERYPLHDMALLYAHKNSKESLNEQMVKNGMAFFDHGYYSYKRRFENLEKKAQKTEQGIWKEKNRLKILYVASKNWYGFHYPECPEVNKIAKEDRIDYYFLPPAIFYYRYPERDCKYCQEIEIKYGRSKLFTYGEEDYLKDLELEKQKKAK